MSKLDEEIEKGNMTCFVCAKTLEQLEELNTNVKDAVEIEIYGHYGSNHDGLRAAGVVCDECVSKLIENSLKHFNVFTPE